MSTKRLRGIGPEPSGPASVSPVAGSGYDTVVLSDPPRSSRNSSKRRASTDVNALIGDAMESMRQKGDEKIREQRCECYSESGKEACWMNRVNLRMTS